MPELPEVQATVDYLTERIVGHRITGASISWPRTLHGVPTSDFIDIVTGRSIRQVFRRGKYVCISLSGSPEYFLLVHLRMSGSLDVVSSESAIAIHDRATIELSNCKSIRFNDTRKFGRIYIAPSLEEIVGGLGVEPLGPNFTTDYLLLGVTGRSRTIKPLLLDQTFIAGLGNIYVDESLWKARIHPTTLSHQISKAKISALHSAIQETLTEAISFLGTDFGDNVVHGGMYRPRVYGREDEPCPRCNKKIRRIVVGQRGTHYCPTCQVKQRLA
jgi:formamidopyrimidine-DNA glycosylase